MDTTQFSLFLIHAKQALNTKVYVLLAALLLSGCNNDNSSAELVTPEVKGNFYVSDLSMQAGDNMSHKDQFVLDYTLHVEHFEIVDVDIDFYMVDTSSTP